MSGIDHVCHVGVGTGDCHGLVWHRGEFGVCGPVVFVPSHGLGFLGAARQVPFDITFTFSFFHCLAALRLRRHI